MISKQNAEVFITTDGTLFIEEQDALFHERCQLCESIMDASSYYYNGCLAGVSDGVSLLTFLQDNKDIIKEILG